MKHYFLTRNKTFVECSLESESPYKRRVKILEGKNAGKFATLHPEGISWGQFYPRLFKSESAPVNPFIFNGRVLLSNIDKHSLVPSINLGYRFQPFLSNVIDSINSSEPVLLTGGTGVGKTTHIVQLAARTNKPILRVNFNGETRLSDFIGKINVLNGQTFWTDGILPLSMKKGYWLILDELDFADPAILSLLHPVLEEDDPTLVLKENDGEVVKPHPEFRIFATANSIGAMNERSTSYSGTNEMNEAFLDRWNVIYVSSLPFKEEVKVMKSRFKGLRKSTITKMVDFAHKIRDKEIDEIDFGDNFSTRKLISWSKKTGLSNRCPVEGAKISWLDKMNKSDHDLIVRILETHFGLKKKKKKQKKSEVTTSSVPATIVTP